MQKSARFSFCCNAAVAYLLEFIIIFPVQFIFKYIVKLLAVTLALMFLFEKL